MAGAFGNTDEFPIFTSVNVYDEPAFSFNAIKSWPFSDNNVNIDEVRRSAEVVDIMKGNGGVSDTSNEVNPLLARLLRPTENLVMAGTPGFVRQPVGLASDVAGNEERSLLSNNFRNLNTFWHMTYAELNFIEAEAIHRNVIAGNAVAAYQ